MKLRDYQEKAINDILSNIDKRKIIVNSVVGSGKSIMISFLTKELLKNNKQVIIGTDISALVPQLQKHLNIIGIEPTVIAEGKIKKGKDNVILGLEQSLVNRLNYLDKNSYLILDEAHKRFNGQRMNKIISYIEPTNIIGFTGTPYDSNGVKLNDWFYINALSLKEGLEKGYLRKVNYKIHKIVKELDFNSLEDKSKNNLDYREEDIRKLYGNNNFKNLFLDFFKKVFQNQQTLIYVSNIKMAEEYKELLQNIVSDIAIVHSKQKKEENSRYIADYKENRLKVLISVSSLTIGFDAPNTELGFILRPTKSYNLFHQIDGRFRRIHPILGSEPIDIYDFTDNVIRMGLPEEFVPFNNKQEAKEAIKKQTIIEEMLEQNQDELLVLNTDTVNKFKLKIEEIKLKKDKNPYELLIAFRTTTDINELVDLYAQMYELKFKIKPQERTIEWIKNELNYYLTILNEYGKFYSTLKAYKTRALNILKYKKKFGALGYFASWFYNETKKKYNF